ncbi:MAG: hypothetical protein KJZ53_09075 [Anaerolineales bacterium]|nr:hypothetical protein [Anaerolineales bacterium]
MKKLSLLLLAVLLAACAAPPIATAPVAPTVAATTPQSQPTEAQQPSFEATTYQDAEGRFSLQYPASWQILGGESGARGEYVQITSWDPGAAGIEQVPAGESLLQITVYQWDPKGDLPARLDMRRTAFNNSGITIAEETEMDFDGGPGAVRMRLVSSGEESIVYFFVLGDENLEISGTGDLQLLDEVIQTFEYGD